MGVAEEVTEGMCSTNPVVLYSVAAFKWMAWNENKFQVPCCVLLQGWLGLLYCDNLSHQTCHLGQDVYCKKLW